MKGKLPVQLLYTTPMFLFAKAPKQNMCAMDSSSTSVISANQKGSLLSSLGIRPGIGWYWLIGAGIGVMCTCRGLCLIGLGVVLLIPLRGHFVCPFKVVGLGARNFWMDLALRCRAPLRNPVLIALMSEVIDRLQRLWCMNFTSLALLCGGRRTLQCGVGSREL